MQLNTHYFRVIQYYLFIFGIFFISCSVSASCDKPVRVVSDAEYRTLDPHVGYDWLSYMTLNPICSNLVGLRGRSHAPDVAKKIEYRDEGRTIIFHLDSERRFHTGEKISAKDVVYSLNRVTSSELNSPGAVFFKIIDGFDEYRSGQTDHLKGVSYIDDHTVQIQTSRASNSFMYGMATNFGCIVPAGFNQTPFQLPISAGPFKASEFNSDGDLMLTGFTDYPVELELTELELNSECIHISTQVDADTALEGFIKDEIDIIIDGLSWAAISSLNANNLGLNVEHFSTTYISLNTQIPPFDNVLLREAVNYAVDRRAIIDEISGAARSTTQILPTGFAEHDADRDPFQYDPEKARKLVEAAGEIKGLDISLYAVDNELNKRVIFSIVSDLQKVGIEVTPYFGTHSQILEIAGNETPGQMIFSDGLGWVADYADPSNFFFPILSKNAIMIDGWNWAHYHNPEVESLAVEIDSIVGEDSQNKRFEGWKKVFNLIQNDYPLIPLYHRFGHSVVSYSYMNKFNSAVAETQKNQIETPSINFFRWADDF